eukprot:Rmarinus@m.7939
MLRSVVQRRSFFGVNPLNKLSSKRNDPATLEELLSRQTAKFLLFDNLKVLMDVSERGSLRPFSRSEIQSLKADALINNPRFNPIMVFLGVDNEEEPYFAVDLSPYTIPNSSEVMKGHKYVDVRSVVFTLRDKSKAPILAQARSMMHFHSKTNYCNSCGSKLRSADVAGYALKCTSTTCGSTTYPRVDPAILAVVSHPTEDKLLLGRGTEFPQGMYSVLAGFTEPGESIEETVGREVMEEVAVPVTDVRYFASQSWPFPRSVMMGFFAKAQAEELTVGEELQDARWFSVDEVRDMVERGSRPPHENAIEVQPWTPPPGSLSHDMIRRWLSQKSDNAS